MENSHKVKLPKPLHPRIDNTFFENLYEPNELIALSMIDLEQESFAENVQEAIELKGIKKKSDYEKLKEEIDQLEENPKKTSRPQSPSIYITKRKRPSKIKKIKSKAYTNLTLNLKEEKPVVRKVFSTSKKPLEAKPSTRKNEMKMPISEASNMRIRVSRLPKTFSVVKSPSSRKRSKQQHKAPKKESHVRRPHSSLQFRRFPTKVSNTGTTVKPTLIQHIRQSVKRINTAQDWINDVWNEPQDNDRDALRQQLRKRVFVERANQAQHTLNNLKSSFNPYIPMLQQSNDYQPHRIPHFSQGTKDEHIKKRATQTRRRKKKRKKQIPPRFTATPPQPPLMPKIAIKNLVPFSSNVSKATKSPHEQVDIEALLQDVKPATLDEIQALQRLYRDGGI